MQLCMRRRAVHVCVFHWMPSLGTAEKVFFCFCFAVAPLCLVPSPWGCRLSRVHSSSPRWPSAILGRVIMGPGGRKPASPLPCGSKCFTSVPKVIMALRYGIKSYKSISVGQQRSGLGGNKSRWGEKRTLQGTCGINYVIIMRPNDCIEQAKAACYLNWHQRWMKNAGGLLLSDEWRLYLYSINDNACSEDSILVSVVDGVIKKSVKSP